MSGHERGGKRLSREHVEKIMTIVVIFEVTVAMTVTDGCEAFTKKHEALH